MHTFDYIAIGVLVALALGLPRGCVRAGSPSPDRALLGMEQDRENPNSDHNDRHRENYRPDLV
jgi:hypothetical protein